MTGGGSGGRLASLGKQWPFQGPSSEWPGAGVNTTWSVGTV